MTRPPAEAQAAARRAPFYGWAVVAALGLALSISVGISFYGVSVYLEALTDDGFSLAAVSWATSAFLLVSGVAGVGVAALLERVDVRWVMTTGALLAGGALLALGSVRTPAQLLLAYAALGIGFAASATIPASTLVTRWFVRRRTLALSLVFLGLPLGGAVLTPPVAALVQAVGVEGAAPWLAAGYVLGVVPVVLAVVRPDPASRGTGPDGDAVRLEPGPAADGGTVRDVLRTGWFWAVTGALMLGMLGQVGTLAHLFNAVTERLGTGTAAATVSAAALASLAGRLVGSWALDRIGLARSAVGLLTLQALATLGAAVAPSTPAVLGCAAAFGVAMGNMQVLHPLLVAERAEPRHYGRVLAASNLGVTAGMAFGPVAVGAARAAGGSYLPGLAVAAAAAAAGAVLLGLLRRPRVPHT
ncbi:MFS transporter [Blastococcus sp. SYSU D00669]